jgi:hypothetical protein
MPQDTPLHADFIRSALDKRQPPIMLIILRWPYSHDFKFQLAYQVWLQVKPEQHYILK